MLGPLQLPALADKVWPFTAVPLTVGAEVLVGADCPGPAVEPADAVPLNATNATTSVMRIERGNCIRVSYRPVPSSQVAPFGGFRSPFLCAGIQ